MKRVYIDVDTQSDFCAPGGALFVTGAPAAVPACARLVRAATRGGNLLVGSVDSHAHDAWEFATNANVGPEGAKPNFPPHCVKGTSGWLKLPETLPERFYFIPVIPDEQAAARIPTGSQGVYFEKEVYSLFANPNAAPVLDAIVPPGSVEFVVFGVATDYCVRAAALGLTEWIAARPDRKGSRVTVASDAIAPVTPAGGEAAEREMRAAGVAFKTTGEILGEASAA
jgi:nicotinamidase/pyrazinamidase